MTIDWKSFIGPLVEKGIICLLTIIATKWADAAVVVQRMMAGDTVPLWHGAVNLNLSQIQLLVTGGAITFITAIIAWVRKVRAKKEVAIALKLPKGATKADVKEIAQATPALSADVDVATLHRISSQVP